MSLRLRAKRGGSNLAVFGMSLFFVLAPFTAQAVVVPRQALKEVYEQRSDLQKIFGASSWRSRERGRGARQWTLEDWAREYGWKEHPELIAAYKPEPIFITPSPSMGEGRGEGGRLQPPPVTAESFIVLNQKTKTVLIAKKPDLVWPLASLTKLITAELVLDAGIAPTASFTIAQTDEVGGGRLNVKKDTPLVLYDLLAAMLIGSANNAAGALARGAGGTHEHFVDMMNSWLADLGLENTHLIDPSGIGVENIGTAREFAKVAQKIFEDSTLRDITSRPRWEIKNSKETTNLLKTTNWLLTDKRYDDLRVLAGKTGYLDEAKWNLAVLLAPTKKPTDRELLIVLLGSGSKRASFDDAASLARWTWKYLYPLP